MSIAERPKTNPGLNADDLGIQVHVADRDAHLLRAAHRSEGSQSHRKGHQAFLGQTGRKVDQVLLGDADIKQTVGKRFQKIRQARGRCGIRSQGIDVAVSLGQEKHRFPNSRAMAILGPFLQFFH